MNTNSFSIHFCIPTSNYSVDAIASVYSYCDWHENIQYFGLPPGEEHYWLLSEIARQLPKGSRVLDVGTYLGFSAVAFSSNPNINIITVDIVDEIGFQTPKQRPNITFLIEDDILSKLHEYVDCPVIMLDTNHEGEFEREFIAKLESLEYKGIVICDDIYLNDAMKEFWQSVQQEKVDVSRVGHWTGTGIIIFDNETVNVSLKEEV
jgi:hypothetical protein